MLKGGCHCGNISFEFESALTPRELPVRACQCAFCRAHSALSTSDPSGSVSIGIAAPARVNRYRFGMKTADFLICSDCGVFIAAVMEADGRNYAVVNINTFDRRDDFTAAPQPMDYEGETTTTRLARRKERWTPATVI